jgi:nicotinamide-nucleotide amidase
MGDDMTADRAPLRTAEVIAVGSELLGWTRVDTNSLIVAELLAGLGIEVRSKAVVGDDLAQISALFREALERSDLVVFTGGLGPTDDDLTRDAVSAVLGLTMEEDPRITAKIQDRFARRGMRMPEVNRRQAMVPRGAAWVDNPVGTGDSAGTLPRRCRREWRSRRRAPARSSPRTEADAGGSV